ncbi:NAD(P)/FAD-dependent oxidoreductase [Anaerospora hongkongensis]|uniref:NAD(P)/FAD-dependent oxidoreductase n=2 Tax=Anaerospora hongkongensis TaxID=244830 RepID=UPI00289C0B5D|nr:FAD-dependent oxidoreductase [Anaerospora hongkongensis]
MIERVVDVAIIGGGPAGLAAANGAVANGAEKVLVIERDRELGGILQQCIHNGFGLHRFHEELTGPGYASRYVKMVQGQPQIETMLDTMVLEVGADKTIIAVNPREGVVRISAKAVIFTMGCRERTRGAIRIPGQRPAGVFTAGAAQRMVNMEGFLPGKNIVILGSGDIGLIMARRMTLEGAKVHACIEIMPYSNGLTRNVVQCLEDFDIPLFLSHSVVKVHGGDRITGITVAQVGDNRLPIPGTEFEIPCDCLLLSVGLIPENELSKNIGLTMDDITGGPVVDQYRQTTLPGFFAAGNVVHVHDLVDFVSEEGDIAGKWAARYGQGQLQQPERVIAVEAGDGIRSVVPQQVAITADMPVVRLFMRVTEPQQKIIIAITAGPEKIMERRLPIAKPGEMIVVDIPADKVRAAGDKLSVQVKRLGGEKE